MKLFTVQEKNIIKLLVGSLLFGSLYTVYRQWKGPDAVVPDLHLESFITAAGRPWIESGAKRPEKKQNQSPLSININTAVRMELMTLPGIGPVMAERIIQSREEFGSFNIISDINRVRGIGTKTFAEIEPFITIEEK
ncbi:MAG: helix-hairpin-helix domain-containing protein [Candidatus Neomarinimicrobiota bacterium]